MAYGGKFPPSKGTATGVIEELRRELEAVKREVRGKAPANPLKRLPNRISDQQTPPKIKGVSIVPNLNTLTVRWNPAEIRQVQNYDIQFSTRPEMFDPDTYSVGAGFPEFTLQGATPLDDFYIRVRAVSQGGIAGDWSNVLSSAVLLANTIHISPFAATTLYSFRKVRGGFYFPSMSSENTVTKPSLQQVGGLTINFTETNDINIECDATFYLSPYKTADTASLIIRYDGVEANRAQYSTNSNATFITNSQNTIFNIANVPAGNHVITAEFQIEETGSPGQFTELIPDKIELRVMKSKR